MRVTKKILISLIVILTLCLLSFVVYIVLQKLNITNIKTLREFVEKFGNLSWIIFLLVQLLLSVPVFVVPLEDELWVSLAILLFGAKKGFILSVVGMALTSYALYILGRVFGIKLANKIVGEKVVSEMQKKSQFSSKFSLPFLYMIPFFPHDVLCMISGINKMNRLYFLVVTIIMRSIEIVALCFLGGDLIKWSAITTTEWIILGNLLIVDIFLLFKFKNYLEKKLQAKSGSENMLENDQ